MTPQDATLLGPAAFNPQALALITNDDLHEVAVNISTATTTAIIAALAGKLIRVYYGFLSAGAAQTVDVKDGSTSLTGGALGFATGGGVMLDLNGRPWFTGTAGAALNLVTTTTGQLSGRLYYTQSAP